MTTMQPRQKFHLRSWGRALQPRSKRRNLKAVFSRMCTWCVARGNPSPASLSRTVAGSSFKRVAGSVGRQSTFDALPFLCVPLPRHSSGLNQTRKWLTWYSLSACSPSWHSLKDLVRITLFSITASYITCVEIASDCMK